MVREALKTLDVREAENGSAALSVARECDPDLALVDLQFPGRLTASELCGQLRAIVPQVRIVIVTAYERAAAIRDCLAAGASGCLLKDTDELDFAAALRAVLAGENFLDPRMAQRIAFDAVNSDGPSLTGREREVLSLLAQGCPNRAIADRLVISETTVKGHVSNLIGKLDASSRLEVVVRASEAGLI